MTPYLPSELPSELRVIGPPGTGKTTELAKTIRKMSALLGPENIVALSHTNAAAAEIAGRDTPLAKNHIGTIHSQAYRAIDSPEVAESPGTFKEFCEANGYQTQASRSVEDLEAGLRGGGDGDVILSELSRMRNMMLPREMWPAHVQTFSNQWEAFKADTGTVDFTDMLAFALRDTDRLPQNPSLIIADEVQDSTPLQLALLWKWAAAADSIIFAGDLDQSIYGFAGASPEGFMARKPKRQHVLTQSYRCPRAVCKWALGWIEQNPDREPIVWEPRDADGLVDYHCDFTWQYPDALVYILERETRSTIVQASCAYMLAPLLAVLRREGIPFGNPWRRSRGDWNPLAPKRGVSTASVLTAFAAPASPDGWSRTEAQTWVQATSAKGLWKHGRKAWPDALPENASVFDTMMAFLDALVDETDYRAARHEGLPWLIRHLAPARQRSMDYLWRVIERRGVQALSEEPTLHVGTIHSFKGAEAEVVYVFPDMAPQGYAQWFSTQGRPEIVRQFYVAGTRAKSELHWCAPVSGACIQP